MRDGGAFPPGSTSPVDAKPSVPCIGTPPTANSAPSAVPSSKASKPRSKGPLAAILAVIGTVLVVLAGVISTALLKDDSETIINNTTTVPGSTETVTQTQAGGSQTSTAGDDAGTTTTGTGLLPVPDPDEEVEVSNRVPDLPEPDSPLDGAFDVPLEQVLEWSASDPDDDPLTFDVYFGVAADNLALLCNDVGEETCDPASLDNEQTYYWKVMASDGNGGETDGGVWSFTTVAQGDDGVCLPPQCHIGG